MMKKSYFLLTVLVFVVACTMATSPALTATALPPTFTATVTLIPTPTLTSTPVPMLTVKEAADCYGGPGAEFGIVSSLDAGQQVEPIARGDGLTYWIVNASGGNQCWVEEQYVELQIGEVSFLPVFTPPPSPTPAPPAEPSELAATYTCEKYKISGGGSRSGNSNKGTTKLDLTIILTWKDNANNENQYQVFIGDTSVAVLPADSVSFTQTFTYQHVTISEGFRYGVRALNKVGTSRLVELEFLANCP